MQVDGWVVIHFGSDIFGFESLPQVAIRQPEFAGLYFHAKVVVARNRIIGHLLEVKPRQVCQKLPVKFSVAIPVFNELVRVGQQCSADNSIDLRHPCVQPREDTIVVGQHAVIAGQPNHLS